jgi:hypothetical protein
MDELQEGKIESNVQNAEGDAQNINPEQEYDSAWLEADAPPKEEEAPEPKDEEPEPQKPAAESKPQPEETPKSDHHGSVESMEKALKDTKAHASRLEQERADLRKKVEELSRPRGITKEQIAERIEAIKKKAPLEDYPELSGFVEELGKELLSYAEVVEEVKQSEAETRRANEFRAKFEAEVKPEVLKVHSDFDSVMHSDEYWQWAKAQEQIFPALFHASHNSMAPQDIVWAITEFKRSRTKEDVQNIKAKDARARQTKLDNARTMKPGGGGTTPKSSIPEADDYDSAWDWAGKQLAKEG